jgi:hypothetical protein
MMIIHAMRRARTPGSVSYQGKRSTKLETGHDIMPYPGGRHLRRTRIQDPLITKACELAYLQMV